MMCAVILFLIAALVVARGDKNCIQRIVGPDAIVCVCNSTYCDSSPDINLKEDEYVWYTSTKSGKRLQSTTANFFNESMPYDYIFTVDTNETFQPIFGFGGTMTDAAAINIRKLSNKTQEKLIESYYGSDGSRYTFCRISIAGTDFSTRPYTYDDIPDDFTLSNLKLVEEDDYKIHYLHQMISVMPKSDPLKIFTTSWSAPAWMKYSNSITWGALKPEYYQLYADYIRKFFDAYKERGITLWGMTSGNEPLEELYSFFPFNAMLWTPSAEANFSANYLFPTLFNAGYDLIYMAMDDQSPMILFYPDRVFHNKKAKKLFSGIAVHWYLDRFFSPMILNELHDQYPDKFILITEACISSNLLEKLKMDLGSWKRGERYILDIIQNLSHWVVGWVDWNLALDKYGAPNWPKNFVDSPIIVIPENDEFYKQPMYYALYHVSKFVLPNSKRISLTGLDPNCDVKAIAFLTPEENVVVVMVNKGEKPYNITIQDKNQPSNLIYLQLFKKSFTTLQYKAK